MMMTFSGTLTLREVLANRLYEMDFLQAKTPISLLNPNSTSEPAFVICMTAEIINPFTVYGQETGNL